MPLATSLALALLLGAAAGDAPRRPVLVAQHTGIPEGLAEARRLASELRFEEAVVAYQRYLGDPNRPSRERARALFELAFIHLLLEDEVNAERRAVEALSLDEALTLPAEAPAKQVAFLERARAAHAARPRLSLVPRATGDAPSLVRARLTDPARRVHRVLLRHALAPAGPFYGSPLRCEGEACQGFIPAPQGTTEYTAWYFLEAVDADGNTIAQASSADAPLQLFVRQEDPWFRNPWVWAGGAALVIGAAAVVYVAAAAGN